MLKSESFEAFETAARAQDFDEVIERKWEPLKVLEEHTHSFAVKARVEQGEFWLTVNGVTRHLRAGDTFELAYQALHAECYGAQGTTIWAARRQLALSPHTRYRDQPVDGR